jgi:alpha/beta superfamily hydrolase
MKFWFFAVGLLLSGSSFSQDYEREQRWAAEVEPNIVVGDAVRLKLPSGREFLGIYTEGKKNAILLVHGSGVHPDFSIIGAMRSALADLGYATLSIQMPVLRADAAADEYVPLFPDAAARIQAGADWLAQKGYRQPVLLSHSMGSRMANAYYERATTPPFAAWVNMGITTPYGRTGNIRVPVLDIYGENDFPSVLRDAWRRKLTIDGIAGSKQVRVDGADHFYNAREKQLATEINGFLTQIK